MKTFLVSYFANGYVAHVHVDVEQWSNSCDTLLVMEIIANKGNIQVGDVVITSVFELVK